MTSQSEPGARPSPGDSAGDDLGVRTREFLGLLESKVKRAEAEAEAARARLDALVTARDALKGIIRAGADSPSATPDAVPAPSSRPMTTSRSYPRGKAAVLEVIRDMDRPVTVDDVLEELDRRGWPPKADDPAAAVYASLRRVVRDGSVTQLPDKTYVVAGTPADTFEPPSEEEQLRPQLDSWRSIE